MGETADKIETYIDQEREDLGSNLRELESKVKATTDWRTHFRKHPLLSVGIAVGGGLILGKALAPPSNTRAVNRRLATSSPPVQADSLSRNTGSHIHRGQIHKHQDNLKSSLIDMAAQRVVRFIDEAVPGFKEQVEKHTST